MSKRSEGLGVRYSKEDWTAEGEDLEKFGPRKCRENASNYLIVTARARMNRILRPRGSQVRLDLKLCKKSARRPSPT